MGAKTTAAPAIKLDTLSDVNDLGKPWKFDDEDTGLHVTRSCVWSPPGCHPVGCGVKLYVDDDGKLVKVEGDENHPVTQGRLCMRCIALKDYIYNPSRVTKPMKRDRKYRGQADKWEECSMDEALSLIEENYWKTVKEHGFESVLVYTGTGRDGGVTSGSNLASMVFNTPNYCYTQSGYACYLPRMAASVYCSGIAYTEVDYAGTLEKRYDDPEYKVPEVIVLWGKEPLASNPDGLFGHAIIDMMKRGSKIIAVDPRVTWIANKADYHLRIRPGTDTALGMAMLDVIIKEKLYDEEFVDQYCYGFKEFAERCATMPPSKAAEICGVDEEDIIGAARMYAKADPATISWGLAVDQKTNGLQNGQVIVALTAITGNIDKPGGQLVAGAGTSVTGGENEDAEMMALARVEDPELHMKMIGMEEYPGYCGFCNNSHADLTLRALETDKPYPVRFAMLQNCNFAANSTAEPDRWIKASAEALDFCFALDCFITPSVQCAADVIIPLATTAETPTVVSVNYGATPVYRGFQNPAIKVGDCMGNAEFAYVMGSRLWPEKFENWGIHSTEDFLSHVWLGKEKFEDLAPTVLNQYDHEYFKYKKGKMRPDGGLGFATPSGRIELWSQAYEQFGDDPLPYYEEPHYSPYSDSEYMLPAYKEMYPFVLTTGARTYSFFHSENRQVPVLREINPDPIFEINPEDAKKKGVTDGMWVRVFNMFGECYLKAHLTPKVKPGVVHAQHGWWFPEEDGEAPHLFGTLRSQINNLIPNFHVGVIGFGAPFKSMICDFEPTDKNFDTDMQMIQEKFGRLD
ncbi:dehydrogenase [Adlercreutzia equolifaciens subsp. celatus]|uniref:Dehydrogenase n=1 Tax=Adlercreutzia equolifaciens subsp. celatus DSM 18785 TaxID=1121021 RepID=A0A3N0AXT4_9ACTN|nr:molybdopterin-dependent oxidoreductase [Adlercreutzia equolifaciens]MCP2077966.1 Anaerobic selenocysteine-containing dehydrogenase [Adlercreutzia equolifaciens subsp. celatus DSM 18785]RFT94882.1 dehydrogenase [Adlercreutzia equolifaciens subsp. celatus]RNL39369.1 dehydrogenase [Adlercreutzia equolifaciens subsp. celatus DSM 18785]BCS58477.1 dehydrogenase [Adlercreutzia equolifaciens subsp. celatus]